MMLVRPEGALSRGPCAGASSTPEMDDPATAAAEGSQQEEVQPLT